MKFHDTPQSIFLKAPALWSLRHLNENAGKITGVLFGAGDAYLASINYFKHGTFGIDLVAATPDDLLSFAGMAYVVSAVFLLGVDRWPATKKPAGALAFIGSLAIIIAAYQTGILEYYAVAMPAFLTGLSMMFETQANSLAQKFSHLNNAGAKAARFYLKYPVATMAITHLIGAIAAIVAGLRDAEPMMLPYGIAWLVGSITLAMTDNHVKETIRKIYS